MKWRKVSSNSSDFSQLEARHAFIIRFLFQIYPLNSCCARTSAQKVFEFFQFVFRPLRLSHDSSVTLILYPASEAERLRQGDGVLAEEDSLDQAMDCKGATSNEIS